MNLFHTLLLTIVYSKTYIFKNKGDFYVNTTNSYKFEYREAINPLFYLYFPNGLKGFNLAYDPLYSISSHSYKSHRPLQNSKYGIIDYIDFYKKEKGFVTILASASCKYNNYNYTLWLDNTLLDISYYKNISYLNRIYTIKGSHRLSLRGDKLYEVTRENGYINSYQIGLWEEPLTQYNSKITTNTSKIKEQNIEYIIHYNDFMNSQPRSSHTRFHI